MDLLPAVNISLCCSVRLQEHTKGSFLYNSLVRCPGSYLYGQGSRVSRCVFHPFFTTALQLRRIMMMSVRKHTKCALVFPLNIPRLRQGTVRRCKGSTFYDGPYLSAVREPESGASMDYGFSSLVLPRRYPCQLMSTNENA